MSDSIQVGGVAKELDGLELDEMGERMGEGVR